MIKENAGSDPLIYTIVRFFFFFFSFLKFILIYKII
jgi:hypothetical protein